MKDNIQLAREKFQFTPLREGRRQLRQTAPPEGNFNSRPCVRGDRFARRLALAPTYFNSRPCVRGDSGTAPHSRVRSAHFNSRPCVRGDLLFLFQCVAVGAFQFTPLREGRRSIVNHIAILC